jgi:hypothetical protein
MNTVELLRSQLENAHQTLEGTVGDISEADAHREPGGRAFNVAALYAHVVFAEDYIVQGMLRQAAPLAATTWAGKTGFSEPMPQPGGDGWADGHDAWARALKADLKQARQYAQAVHQNALEYIASLTQEDVDRVMDLHMVGSMPLGMVITLFVIGHYYSLAGEISAAKGVIGLQGYPF